MLHSCERETSSCGERTFFMHNKNKTKAQLLAELEDLSIDVTERKQTESLLRESEMRFRRAIEEAPSRSCCMRMTGKSWL